MISLEQIQSWVDDNNAEMRQIDKSGKQFKIISLDNKRFNLIKKFIEDFPDSKGSRADGQNRFRDIIIDGLTLKFKDKTVSRGSTNTRIFESCYCWEASREFHGEDTFKDYVNTPGVTYEQSQSFLEDNEDWAEAIGKSVKLIVSNLKNISTGDDYSFERGSENVKYINNVYESLSKNIDYFGDINKWNPSDIYVFKKSGMEEFKKEISEAKAFEDLNAALINLYYEGICIGISLKKTGKPEIKKINFSIPIQTTYAFERYEMETGRTGDKSFWNSKNNLIYFKNTLNNRPGRFTMRSDGSALLSWVIEIDPPDAEGKYKAQHGKLGKGSIERIYKNITNEPLGLMVRHPREEQISDITKYFSELEGRELEAEKFNDKSDDWIFSKWCGVVFIHHIMKLDEETRNKVIDGVVDYAKSMTKLSAPHLKIEALRNKFKKKIKYLRESKQITGLVPMAGKPIHAGHWSLIEYASENCDKVYVFASNKDRERPGEIPVKGQTMQKIWNEILAPKLPENCELVFSGAPVGDVYKVLGELTPGTYVEIYTGDDDKDNYPEKRLKSYKDKNINVTIKSIDRTDTSKTVNISGTRMREYLRDGKEKEFTSYLPDVLSDQEKKEYWNLLTNDIKQLHKEMKMTWKMLNVKCLNEADSEGKNIHSTHVEDLFFEYGSKGLSMAISFIEQLISWMQSKKSNKSMVTTKIDGSPSVLYGKDPKTNQFFISTKGAFAKTPKLCYSHEDIEKYFGDKPDLAGKIKIAFDCLKKLNIKEIYQGDFLYEKSDLKMQDINGTKYITFTPNTITYAINVNSQTAIDIHKSKMGIAVHTMYVGEDISTAKSAPIIDFKYSSPEIWVMPITTGSYVKTSSTFFSDIEKQINSIRKEKDSISFDDNFTSLINIFINDLVRSQQTNILNDPNKTEQIFIEWVQNRYNKEMDKLKSTKGKESRQRALDNIVDYIKSINFKKYIKIYNDLRIIKNELVRELNRGLPDIRTFFRGEDGSYDETTHEGFAAQGVKGIPVPVKLVNRDEFSRLNFMASKNR